MPPSVGDIFIRDPEPVRVVRIGDRGRIGPPALVVQTAGIEIRVARLVKRRRAEGGSASAEHRIIVGRIHVRPGGRKIDEHVAVPVDRNRRVEHGDTRADGRAGNDVPDDILRIRGIGDIELEPLDSSVASSSYSDFKGVVCSFFFFCLFFWAGERSDVVGCCSFWGVVGSTPKYFEISLNIDCN